MEYLPGHRSRPKSGMLDRKRLPKSLTGSRNPLTQPLSRRSSGSTLRVGFGCRLSAVSCADLTTSGENGGDDLVIAPVPQARELPRKPASLTPSPRSGSRPCRCPEAKPGQNGRRGPERRESLRRENGCRFGARERVKTTTESRARSMDKAAGSTRPSRQAPCCRAPFAGIGRATIQIPRRDATPSEVEDPFGNAFRITSSKLGA